MAAPQPHEVFAWGSNAAGCLGRSDPPEDGAEGPAPDSAAGQEAVKQIKQIVKPRALATALRLRLAACGQGHAMWVTDQDEVYVSGSNDHGQIGPPEEDDDQDQGQDLPAEPYLLEALSSRNVRMVACGAKHTLIVSGVEADCVQTCGANDRGQLGKGQPTKNQIQTLPLSIPIKSIAVGANHCMVLAESGQVMTWGANNKGQLGLGHQDDVAEPCRLEGLQDVRAIAAGSEHSAVLLGLHPIAKRSHGLCSHNLLMFGDNSEGQLGLGEDVATVCEPSPVRELSGLQGRALIHSVWCGSQHTFMQVAASQVKRSPKNHEKRQAKMQVFACGRNAEGQLALGSVQNRSVTRPERVDALDNCEILDVALGVNTSFVWVGIPGKHSQSKKKHHRITAPGIYGCGDNALGQLGLSLQASRTIKDKLTAIPGIPEGLKGRISASSFVVVVPQEDNNKEVPKHVPQIPIDTELIAFPEEQVSKDVPPPVMATTVETLKKTDPPDSSVAVSSPTSSSKTDDVAAQKMKKKKKKKAQAPPQQQVLPETKQHQAEESESVLEELSRDMEKLLDGHLLCDVAFLATKGENTTIEGIVQQQHQNKPKVDGGTDQHAFEGSEAASSPSHRKRRIFPAHSVILQCRCGRIAQIVQQHVAKKERSIRQDRQAGSGWDWRQRVTKVELDISEAALGVVLRFIYTGRASPLEKIGPGALLDVAWAAKTYSMDRLLALCQQRIASVLTAANAIPVLGQASKLELLAIKRICLDFICDNYEDAVSSRNRVAVDTLNTNPALLAEIVGMSSAQFARSLLESLPEPLSPSKPSLVHDLARLRDAAVSADIDLLPTSGKTVNHVAIPCHSVIFAIRCPSMLEALREHFGRSKASFYDLDGKRKRGGVATLGVANSAATKSGFPVITEDFLDKGTDSDSDSSSSESSDDEQDDRQTNASVKTLREFLGKHDRARSRPMIRGVSGQTGRLELQEITEASPKSIRVFLDFLYSETLDGISLEHAIDVLMMCHVYGLQDTRLSAHCKALLHRNLAVPNVVDVLCVARLLGCDDLENSAVNYFSTHSRECMRDHTALVRDAIADFPDLAIRLLEAVSNR